LIPLNIAVHPNLRNKKNNPKNLFNNLLLALKISNKKTSKFNSNQVKQVHQETISTSTTKATPVLTTPENNPPNKKNQAHPKKGNTNPLENP
jgi:hypothetical protein